MLVSTICVGTVWRLSCMSLCSQGPHIEASLLLKKGYPILTIPFFFFFFLCNGCFWSYAYQLGFLYLDKKTKFSPQGMHSLLRIWVNFWPHWKKKYLRHQLQTIPRHPGWYPGGYPCGYMEAWAGESGCSLVMYRGKIISLTHFLCSSWILEFCSLIHSVKLRLAILWLYGKKKLIPVNSDNWVFCLFCCVLHHNIKETSDSEVPMNVSWWF